jgi:deazaflavin-dependent oxidoreductase (nitroreductase family)
MSENQQPQFLYLTTTGRKSGKPHQIEIWFVMRDGCYYLIHEGDTYGDWQRNIFNDPKVTFSVGSRDAAPIDGTGREVDPSQEPELAAAVRGLMDAKYQWSNGSIMELKPNQES